MSGPDVDTEADDEEQDDFGESWVEFHWLFGYHSAQQARSLPQHLVNPTPF
jgi:hypothetical protein